MSGKIIRKNMTVGEINEALEFHDLQPLNGNRAFVINGLLAQCDYIKIDGFGAIAKFILCTDEPQEAQDV